MMVSASVFGKAIEPEERSVFRRRHRLLQQRFLMRDGIESRFSFRFIGLQIILVSQVILQKVFRESRIGGFQDKIGRLQRYEHICAFLRRNICAAFYTDWNASVCSGFWALNRKCGISTPRKCLIKRLRMTIPLRMATFIDGMFVSRMME